MDKNFIPHLLEALPFLTRFSHKIMLVKFGGNALHEHALDSFCQDIALLHSLNLRLVVVHGGGPQISQMLERLKVKSQFINGLRVTSPEVMQVVKMVLLGEVNPQIVAKLNLHGVESIGLSGCNQNLFEVVERHDSAQYGLVGQINSVNLEAVLDALQSGLVPVIAPIGLDKKGRFYNINADTAACHLAKQLKAEKLIFLTNQKGVLDKDKKFIPKLNPSLAQDLISQGVIQGGMIPKINEAIGCMQNKITKIHIIDGRLEHSLLLELLTNQGIGTMIEAD